MPIIGHCRYDVLLFYLFVEIDIGCCSCCLPSSSRCWNSLCLCYKLQVFQFLRFFFYVSTYVLVVFWCKYQLTTNQVCSMLDLLHCFILTIVVGISSMRSMSWQLDIIIVPSFGRQASSVIIVPCSLRHFSTIYIDYTM